MISRTISNTFEIRPRPVRDIAREAVGDIDHTIQRMRAEGVSIEDGSRLHQARAILQRAAETGVLVPAHRGDQLGLRALEIAFDYTAIATTLPNPPVAAFRREMRDSLRGTLEPAESARGPLQLQSQGIVRAAFLRGGLVPTHPTHSPKAGISSPDLVLENGSQSYAIEAKRPQLTKNVLPRFDDARDQLADFGLRGGILVDVTDCLRNLSGDEIDAEVSRLALSLSERVFISGRGFHQGYSGIMVAGTYARVAWSSDDRKADAVVAVHTSSRIGIFAQTKNSLSDHHARWMREAFEVGLSSLNQALAARARA